ncbi:MAG: hypothetical protein PHS44_06710 [Candidatus Dojkabacteria bacterium]|nr:hypothetical protein [Candidatus Dojkabacteria bacterium]
MEQLMLNEHQKRVVIPMQRNVPVTIGRHSNAELRPENIPGIGIENALRQYPE